MFKVILFEQLKVTGSLPAHDEVKHPIDKSDLASYILELDKNDKIAVTDVPELAHAWGNDQISTLEAFVFLKKAGARRDQPVGLENLEKYLDFESKYSGIAPSVNIHQLLRLLFSEEKVTSEALLYHFLLLLQKINTTYHNSKALEPFKTYFDPGDLESLKVELEAAKIIGLFEAEISAVANYIGEHLTHFPK